MLNQTSFKRYELKYLLTNEQYLVLCKHMAAYMKLDKYGRHKISNIYFDTEDYKIIRHSIEKPKYKEKLRIRIYGEPDDNANAFIELKKKYDGVVYKRRISIPQKEALAYMCHDVSTTSKTQIQKEIDYFKSCYKTLKPKVYLAYEREAFWCIQDANFRITFDFNIKMRDCNISPYQSDNDIVITQNNVVILEVKTVQGLPFWFIDFLNKSNLYSTSFSKYGTAYKTHIQQKIFLKEGV